MSSISIYETSLTRSIKFWILLILQTPSIFCSIFVLHHMFISRTQRHLLANHVVIVMLIVCFFSVITDLSITLNFLQDGIVHVSSSSFCYFWMYIDYVLYANGMLLMTWASIERHILVFASQYFRLSRQKFYGHYIPIIICLVYPFIFYIYTIFFYPCDQIFDYQQVLCGSPCFKRTTFLLNAYDMFIHSVLPCIIIVAFSFALLIRVVRHKRRIQGQTFSRRKQRRMVVQLLSIACLYIIMNAPPFIVIGIQVFLSKTFAATERNLYLFYLYYFLTLFLPFVCLGSVRHLRSKIVSLLRTMKCHCLVRSSRVAVIHVDRLSIQDHDNDKKVVRKGRHRYERPSKLHADLALKHPRKHEHHQAKSRKITYSKFVSNMVQLHNYYRARHSASPLTISQRLNYIAQKYAEYLAATSKFEHSGNRFENESLGENLYMQWISHGKVPVSAREATKSWYDEIELYSFKRPYYSEETGHFTQMVWKSTQKIGIGVALSADEREVYIVANYYPAGNIINPGYFEKNVLPAKY
ncbi:unnamed protein product [Rotaria sp. Silwood1]|nr:unnamed protein product [Rotaria sp. Silwood1]CAF1288774.1 unnamed protein product [Rotaria sp. Silwood1]CAF3526597.1 unnamed protein product [Rotaria sp. Silwood1]CAF4649162.1 unnamed protein product [Rotaria sp. Silwood1]